jgi:hypothetical protein
MPTYKGHDGEITKDGATIAYVTSFSIEEAPNIEPVYELGSRSVSQYHAGRKEITGSFEKMFTSTEFLGIADSDSVPTFTFEGIVETPSAGNITITLSEVTLNSWSFDMPEDDFVTESVDFQAGEINYTST